MARHTFHSPAELEAWAGQHLVYEIEQLASMSVLLARDDLIRTTLGTAIFVSNALFESYLNHIRTLDDFLGFDHEPDPRRDPNQPTRISDVLAVDYLPAFDPTPILEPAERRQINVRLAHVSISRSPEQQPWDILRSTGTALERFGAFVEKAEDPNATLRIDSPAVLRRAFNGAASLLTRYGLLASS